MFGNRRFALQAFALVICLGFVAGSADAQREKKSTGTANENAEGSASDTLVYKGVKDLATLKDGAYDADGWYRQWNYRSVSFLKRGKTVTGFTSSRAGVWCIQGTFEGNIITISDAVNWDEEYENGRRTGRYVPSPLREEEKEDFVTIRVAEQITTFPVRRRGHLRTSPTIVARDEKWMDGCLKYFSESNMAAPPVTGEGPAPCGDEQLRPTMPKPDQPPAYLGYPSEICDTRTDRDCTVENVFALLRENPAAIGPAKDPEGQVVENCGVLVLEAFTDPLLPRKYEADNRIKVEINQAHHRIINYTMPGHVFWPGQVHRQIVMLDGKVRVRTAGYGNENFLTRFVNIPSGIVVWLMCDGVLKDAYKERY